MTWIIMATATYDKPVLLFYRFLELHRTVATSDLYRYERVLRVPLRERLWIEPLILQGLEATRLSWLLRIAQHIRSGRQE